MKYFVKNDLSRILDKRFALNGDVISFMRGGKITSYPSVDFTQIDVSDEKALYGLNKELFEVVDGKAKIKTITKLKGEKDVKDKIQAKKDLKLARNEALEAITVEVNGNVFQSRKSDEMNFRLAIGSMEAGEVEEWILEDDSIVEVTKEDLEQAYVLGLTEGKRIFAEYKEALKKL